MFGNDQNVPADKVERALYIQMELLDEILHSDLHDPDFLGKAIFLAKRAHDWLLLHDNPEEANEIADFMFKKVMWCIDFHKAQELKSAFGMAAVDVWEENLSDLPSDPYERREVIEMNRRTNEVITKLLVEVEKNAITDILTGLHNRRHFEEMIHNMIERANRYEHQNFALLLIDVDHFKRFNDKYGHQTGDDALRVVAELLKDALRKTDIAARFGGEEFACLLPMTSVPGATIFAERLRYDIERFPFIVEIEDAVQGYQMNHVSISVSIGIAEYVSGDNAAEVIKRADRALYHAKERGRNCVVTSE